MTQVSDRPAEVLPRNRWWVRDSALGLAVFAVSVAFFLVRFRFPRPIGFSDNGDGWRVLCELHANAAGGPQSSPYVQFLYSSANTCPNVNYVSTQVWFGRIAQILGHFVGPRTGFDLTLLAVVSSVFAAAALALVVIGLPVAFRWRVAIGVLLTLLVADSGFFGFFASVDTEGAAFIGLVYAVGGLLLLSRPDAWRYVGAIVAVFGGVVASNAKAQTVVILPLFVIAVLFLPRVGRTWRARWSLPLLVVTATTVVTGYLQLSYSFALPGSDTRTINVYDAVFHSILDGHHDTSADLASLGLPQSFSKYIDTYYWGPVTAVNDPLWPSVKAKFTTSTLVDYYEHHPARTAQILNDAGRDLMTVRPDYTGSFDRAAGFPPASKEWRVPLLSGLLRLASPLGLYFLAPLWLLIALGGIRSVRQGAGRRAVGVVVFLLLAVALTQFLEAGLVEGIENVKHQVIAAFSTLFALILAPVGLLGRAEPE